MIGRLAYAALFSILLPAALIAWGARLDHLLTLPAYGAPIIGWPIAASGLVLMLAATRSLWVVGGGLPASPYPPRQYVSSGVYRLFAHPVYLGALLVSVGVSLATRSPAGLWIVTPTLTLAIVAWVIGFERDATVARFGATRRPILSLPPAIDEPATMVERFAFVFVVLVPWLTGFMAIELLGAGPDARSTFMAWDASFPVIPWTESVYFSTYVISTLAPFVVRTKRELRQLALDGIWATLIILPLYIALPFVAEAKPVSGDGFWVWMLRFERAGDAPATAFPSFHIVWACIAATTWARRFPRWRWPLVALVLATGIACVTTGMHSAADIAAGIVAWVVVIKRAEIWNALRVMSENVANSWRERRIGAIRLMSHGVYAAAGVTLTVAIAVTLVGREQLWWLVGIAVVGVLGAAVWAQLVEGSPQLLRPFGYFGSLVAVPLAAAAVAALHGDGWLLLCAIGIGSTFGQAVGRLRCLVQGCCHGRASSESTGITYTHPQSRVVRLSALGGIPVHPTPLYSMIWTPIVGAMLLRLWSVEAPLSFIAGMYFILVGAGRFVEEHFRGEPQTRTIAGLRVYQWLAIAMMVTGGVVSSIATAGPPPIAQFDGSALLPLAALFVLCYFAYGVDFPDSSRRFSRLA